MDSSNGCVNSNGASNGRTNGKATSSAGNGNGVSSNGRASAKAGRGNGSGQTQPNGNGARGGGQASGSAASSSDDEYQTPSLWEARGLPEYMQVRACSACGRCAAGGERGRMANGFHTRGGRALSRRPHEQAASADGTPSRPCCRCARRLPAQQGNIVAFREHLEEASLRRAAQRRGKTADIAALVWLIIRCGPGGMS